MNIGFDARMINHSGIGVYIRNLLRELLPMAKAHSWTLFGPKDSLQSLVPNNVNARIIESRLPIYSVSEQIFHPVLRDKLDLFHAPHYNFPIAYRGKLVVTLHDLNHLILRKFLTSRFAYPYAKFMIGRAARRADKIIFVSEATLNDFKNFFSVNGTSCKVIHEAVNEEFFERLTEQELSLIRKIYQLPEHYSLFVGNLKPNKNLVTVIRQFRNARAEGFPERHLVIVGKRFPQHPEILEEIRKGEREGFLHHLEDVREEDLKGIYQMSELFLFLSLHEGFGLPILEAFASGVPVLGSDISSIPEIAGNGALLVDPYDEAQIKEALIRLFIDKELRQNLAEKGKAELARFSWRKTAEETLRLYESIGCGTSQNPKIIASQT